jgi:ankyrin repeat protein
MADASFVDFYRTIDLNASNAAGETSLHVAARFGFVDVVRILLDYGAEVSVNFTHFVLSP